MGDIKQINGMPVHDEAARSLAHAAEGAAFNRTRSVSPLVTFADDDGRAEVWSKLKPLSETYGIPFVSAMITDRIGTDGYLTAEQLLSLQDMGWEIASHTMRDARLGDLTDAEQEEQLRGSKEALEAIGIRVDTICYPYSSTNDSTWKIARKYYRAGRQTNWKERMNESPLETWDLRVTPIGSYYETQTESGLDTSTLEYYKWMVDKAVSENAWLIFMTHCEETDDTQMGYLAQVIEYVQSLGIPVVTIREGLDRRGNIVDVGRYDRRNPEDEHFVVGCDSTVEKSAPDKYAVNLPQGAVTNDTPPSWFPWNTVSTCRVTGSTAGFPFQANLYGGTLVTNTMGTAAMHDLNYRDYTDGRTWQEFYIPKSTAAYRRYAIDADTWSDWSYGSDVVLAQDSRTIDDLVTAFPKGMRSKVYLTQNTETTVLPGYHGWLTTDRTDMREKLQYQVYMPMPANGIAGYIYYRAWTGSAWNPWTALGERTMSTWAGNQDWTPKVVGANIFNSDLGKPVWWNGTVWVGAEDAAINEVSKAKADKAGWTPDKYIGTDAEGNLVEKDVPTGGGSGTVTSVNGNAPDANGNVTVEVGRPTDEQIATAVEAWLDEHPEATTTVADGSITREKMAFPAYEGALSPNLADPSLFTRQRFTNANGNRQTFTEGGSYAEYWRTTDYIDVSEHIGEQLWVSHWQGYCFYDDTKTAISGSGQFISSIPSVDSTDPITIPDGVAYIAVAFDVNKHPQDKTAFMANWGEELLSYVPYGDIILLNASVGDAQINGKLSLDKVDTADLLFPTIGKNLVDKSQMVKNKVVDNTGAIIEKDASLKYYFVGDIKVTGGADYLVYATNVVFFDAYGNMCGSDGVNGTFAYRKIKAPISAVSCVVNGRQYDDVPSHRIHNVFMVEGSVLPEKVVCEKIYGEKTIEPNIIGKSVLHRMADCWNPSTKTVIGLCGDSNTRGIMGNGDTTQNPNCWANLVTAEIEKKCSGERYIYPFGEIGVWGCTSYNYIEPQIRDAGVIKIPFYGTSIGLVWGTLVGTVDFNVTIDEGETTVTTVPDTGYTWDGLTEGYHTITLEWSAAGSYSISHFVVNKTIEVINRGISGRSFVGINADLDITGDTVDIICYGTNNRGNGDVNGYSVRELDYFEYRNRETELIYMSPIPAWDSIEEANEAWKTIPYIESFIAGREARHNREYISLYHEIKDYCTMNNVELTSLYVEGLHLNDAGHKVVAKILCRKLGLGDLSE